MTEPARASTLLQEVLDRTAGRSGLDRCIQCGTCSGSCPSADDMDHTPRALFAMIRAEMRDAVLRSNTPWICVSCYGCVVRCPQEIHITDTMYALKSMAVEAGLCRDSAGPDFSRTFAGMVEQYGRSFELGLATRHYLRHFPLRLPGMAPMGLGLISRHRLELKPSRIVGIEQLRAILARARELEERP